MADQRAASSSSPPTRPDVRPHSMLAARAADVWSTRVSSRSKITARRLVTPRWCHDDALAAERVEQRDEVVDDASHDGHAGDAGELVDERDHPRDQRQGPL